MISWIMLSEFWFVAATTGGLWTVIWPSRGWKRKRYAGLNRVKTQLVNWITPIILKWKWISLSLMKNHLLIRWDCLFPLKKLNLDSFYEVYFPWEYYYYYVWLVAPSSNLDMLEKVQKQVVLVPHLMFLLKPKLIAEL